MEWITPVEAIRRLGGDFRLLGETIAPRLQIGSLNAQADHFFVNDVRQGEDGKPCPVPARFWKIHNLSGTWKSGDFVGGGNPFAKDTSTFRASGVRLLAADIDRLREEIEPYLSIPTSQSMDEVPPIAPMVDKNVGENLPLLPASAKSQHWKHLRFAHLAARKLRADAALLPEQAFKLVAPQDPSREPASIIRAIRSTFDLIYNPKGEPLNIDQD